jgi:RsiW-degrading membrane proteinase PrsW (M82 family)
MQSAQVYPPPTSQFHWPSFFQFLFSLLAALGMWGLSLVLFLLGLSLVFQPSPPWADLTQLYLTAATMGMIGTLLVPSAVFAFGGMRGQPIEAPSWLNRVWHPTLLILFLPVILFLGDQISRQPQVAWFGLPPLHILAVGLPVLWLLWLGRRGLPAGSAQRIWGIFGAGLALGPSLILIVEMVALLAVLVLVSGYISSIPGLVDELNLLMEYWNEFGEIPLELLEQFSGHLARPEFLFLVFAFVAGFVPLVEEAIKPIGVILFSGRILTPVQGFTAGLLSGAGFAFFENLLLSTIGGEWTSGVILRIGAGLLHIAATGLVGWGLGLAWREKRYFRLVLAYLTAVVIHGLWNGLALLTALPGLGLEGLGVSTAALQEIALASGIGLFSMAVLMFVILIASNISLRRKLAREETQAG